MAKERIKLVNQDGEEMHSPMPKIVGVSPCGAQVLLELLTHQEMMNTCLTVTGEADRTVPHQAYVRSAGPNFKAQDWGFKVGDRVLISGSGVLAPNYDDSHRDRFLMEPSAVKCVLEEGK